MVKLNSKLAKEVEQAEEWGDFSAVPEGPYLLRLMETSLKEGSEFPYIEWVFKIEEGAHSGSQQWLNTSLSPKSRGSVKMAFSAFGVPANTDTEELHGQLVGAHIVQRVIQKGARKGEMGNDISRLFPAEEFDSEDGEAGEDEPDF